MLFAEIKHSSLQLIPLLYTTNRQIISLTVQTQTEELPHQYGYIEPFFFMFEKKKSVCHIFIPYVIKEIKIYRTKCEH